MYLYPKTPVNLAENTKIEMPGDKRNRIFREVEAATGVPPHAIKGNRRTKGYVMARYEVAYRLRTEMGLSLPRIGVILGGRDHATIIHGLRKWCKENGKEYPNVFV